MENLNTNLLNLIASYKKTGQSDDVIKQSLWQLGMIPEIVESHMDYYNKHTAQINKDNKIVKENKDMKLTLVKLHENAQKTISALEDMASDNSLGYSASKAKQIIECCLASLQITKDDEMVMQEKIKAGYAIDEDLVNPMIKYTVAEQMYNDLIQYEWLMPVSDLRKMIAETFVGDKWNYVSAKFAKAISGETSNEAFANLYESLINMLCDTKDENSRLALKKVLLENAWNRDAKNILASIVAEEKAEQGKVDERIYENSNCSIIKNFSPCLVDENKKVFNLNGKNYIFDGEKLLEAAVSDLKYKNVLEGLSLMKYEADKDRFVYYGKNNLMLEMNCETLEVKLSGVEGFNDMSIIDINEKLKRCGIFDRETIQNCDKLTKLIEGKDMLREIDCATTIANDKFAGVFVSIINVSEGVYVNKVNHPFGINELVLCESAKKACDEIKKFMKYDATKLLEARLKEEGEKDAIIESEIAEIKDTLTFLSEKRSQLIAAKQETNDNEEIQSALELIESEIRKFEKQLQETYSEKKN